MQDDAPLRDVPLSLTWDSEVEAGYFALTEIGPGEAASQRVVKNPVHGIGEIILDFDAAGRLLGIEFLDERALPPGITPS